MTLSPTTPMVYVLKYSGVVGRLVWGRVESDGPHKLSVYDERGEPIEYFSDLNVRSWCVFGADGKPLDEWREILPEDFTKIFPTST